MKKRLFTILAASLLATACFDYDDFAFTGTVVDYELCTSVMDLGYAVQLTSPDSIGARYMTRDSVWFDNVVVVYESPEPLKKNSKISGRMFLDPKYSRAECDFHYDRDVPEARFTKVKVEK